MNKKLLQLVAVIALLSSTVTLFQNCGKEIDLAAYTNLGSQGDPTDPPVITVAPQSTTVTAMQPFSITIQASGQNLTYRWYQGSTLLISGASTSTYSVAQATDAHAGAYRVEVSNAYGTDSREFTIVVSPDPNQIAPAISTAATPLTAIYGVDSTGTRYFFENQITDSTNYNLARFTVVATGPNLTYQWYYVDAQNQLTAISGATAATLAFHLTTASQLGAYRVVVKNASGEISSQATLNATAALATMSLLYGGGGGAPFTPQVCPAGSYGIGLQLRTGNVVDRVGIRCGNPTSTYISAGAGGNGGTAQALICPADRYLTGINIVTGSVVDRIQGYCSDKLGGNSSLTTYYGGNGGVSLRSFRCPVGFVISEIRGRSGDRVDALQFVCRFSL